MRHTDLLEDQYSIPANVKSKAMTSNSQVNDTSSGVPSFIYQNDIQMEGIYSIADGEQVGESLYNHFQRNWEKNTINGIIWLLNTQITNFLVWVLCYSVSQ